MKVCLLNDSFPPVIDGVANVVMNYGRIMQEENLANVAVGTPRYPGVSYYEYPYMVIPYQSFDTTKIVNGYRAGNPVDIKEIHDLIDFNPDIIHSHCPVSSNILARIIRANTQAPLVFTYHTKFDIDIAKAVKNKFVQEETIRMLVSNIEACDEVWVVSEGAGENLRSLGYNGDYRVVSNGVDFAKGKVDIDTVMKVTKDYDLPMDVPVYLFVGRIVKYKGLPIILDALKMLADKGQKFRMVIVGSGPDEEEIKDKARSLGLYDNPDNKDSYCIFTGAISDRNVLRAWNTRADLFLFPSTYDTNGIVVREAAACGLASVLIKDSCAAEGITDGRNGYLIEENAESMAALLKRLGYDIESMGGVGQHAMDEIYISWEDSVHAAYDRYCEIIELKKQGHFARKWQTFNGQLRQFTDDIFEEAEKIISIPERIFDNMLDNAFELNASIKQFGENIKEFNQSISDEMNKNFDELIDKARRR